MKKQLSSGLVSSVILCLILYWLILPPVNPTAPQFWIWIWISLLPLLVSCITSFTLNKIKKVINAGKTEKRILIAYLASIILVSLISFISSPLFHASEYANRITLKEAPFTDIKEVDFTKTAIIDRNSTLVLGDRTLGQLPELISQFDVSDIYSQISYQDSVIRVTPLDYNGFYKYIINRTQGVPAYITVNATNGKSDLIKLEDLGIEGMRYTENAYLLEDRDRHLRLAYPGKIFYETNFEINEQGIPYWITSTITYKGIGQKPTISGVVAMNAVDGTMDYYEVGAIPEWIDRVYPSQLVIDQVNQSGAYVHGLLNSMFGQMDVYKTTDGYNYIELDGDIWLYTGITSANADESNIGFVLINQRTQEAKKIMSAGAEEFSAMSSAEGKVQNLGYKSTFPLLINVGGRPTYLVSLKDNAGLVKMYAMIDCEDYQQVITVDKEKGLEALKREYLSAMNLTSTIETESTTITVKELSTANIDGFTYYFIKDTKDNIYKVKISVNEAILPFMKQDDTYHISFSKSEDILEITGIKKVK